MQTPLVLTLLGRDRTGLVQSLARLVADHGGNWLESRMCRLGGEFAGILRFSLPTDQQSPFVSAVDKLKQDGLSIVVKPDTSTPHQAAQKSLMSLDLLGNDRPGIVRQLTSVLADHGVNLEEFTTECASAPMSGQALFKAEARVLVPESCDIQKLRHDLERTAADLMVDLRLVPVE